MKRLLNILTLLFAGALVSAFFLSCAGSPVAKQPVCSEPDAENSWICYASAQAGITPEAAGDLILKTNVAAILAGAYEREQAAAVVKRGLELLNIGTYTYTDLIYYFVGEIENVDLMAVLISDMVPVFLNDKIIGDFDRSLLRSHLQHHLSILER